MGTVQGQEGAALLQDVSVVEEHLLHPEMVHLFRWQASFRAVGVAVEGEQRSCSSCPNTEEHLDIQDIPVEYCWGLIDHKRLAGILLGADHRAVEVHSWHNLAAHHTEPFVAVRDLVVGEQLQVVEGHCYQELLPSDCTSYVHQVGPLVVAGILGWGHSRRLTGFEAADLEDD